MLLNLPGIHGQGAITYGLSDDALRFLDAQVTRESRTLETGAGVSTLLFAAKGATHTCITPSGDEIARLTAHCKAKGASLERVRFIEAFSQVALPGLVKDGPLDLVLIDGGHGFPVPFVDWYLTAPRIRINGLLIVDDTQLWTGEVLRDFLKAEPEWRVEAEFVRGTAFRKVGGCVEKEWNEQPYVLERSDVPGQPRSKAPRGPVAARVEPAGGANPAPAGAPGSRSASAPAEDLTRQFDYQRLVEEEKTHYSEIEVTETLKEGGVHASNAWQHYWVGVGKVIAGGAFANIPQALSRRRAGSARRVEILSLGSGYCGNELDLARGMRVPYRITCTDLNPALFEKARAVATAEQLSLEFAEADLNFIEVAAGRYDLIFAHASLHHVINVERLFDQMARGLAPGGMLHLVEVVGKNRKLIWDESERYANALLELLPAEITGGIRLDVKEDESAMEGVRQEAIGACLRRSFRPVFEHWHGAFMRFICTHPDLAPRFDPGNPERRRYLDFLIEADDQAVRSGVLRPLEVWGVYEPVTSDDGG
jgi:predicted O-methyltransferase YrrM